MQKLSKDQNQFIKIPKKLFFRQISTKKFIVKCYSININFTKNKNFNVERRYTNEYSF